MVLVSSARSAGMVAGLHCSWPFWALGEFGALGLWGPGLGGGAARAVLGHLE
jgi:hypothetical protein